MLGNRRPGRLFQPTFRHQVPYNSAKTETPAGGIAFTGCLIATFGIGSPACLVIYAACLGEDRIPGGGNDVSPCCPTLCSPGTYLAALAANPFLTDAIGCCDDGEHCVDQNDLNARDGCCPSSQNVCGGKCCFPGESCCGNTCCPPSSMCLQGVCCPPGTQNLCNGQCCPGPCDRNGNCCAAPSALCADGSCCGLAGICVNGTCSTCVPPAGIQCGNQCCGSDTGKCINNACCPNAQACGGTCCPAGTICNTSGQCVVPQACPPGEFLCVSADKTTQKCCPGDSACCDDGSCCGGSAGPLSDSICCGVPSACCPAAK